jgi:hypothetical protein
VITAFRRPQITDIPELISIDCFLKIITEVYVLFTHPKVHDGIIPRVIAANGTQNNMTSFFFLLLQMAFPSDAFGNMWFTT